VEEIRQIPASETEQMMKLQDMILKAMAKKINWIEAAEIAGMSVRNMQRKRQAYQEHGYTGLFDQRRSKRSIHRVPMETAEKVLELFQTTYSDYSVRHFHEKLSQDHGIELSYSWVKQALQGAGLVVRRKKRGPHRRRRERKPLRGMMLHIDGSKHRWFNDDRYYDLLIILDDATSEIYYAQLVEEESTQTVMAGLREVIESQGLFCSLYSDRGSHFFYTPKAGESVDKTRLTQVGRAMRDLQIQMIPAYSPQARGRCERSSVLGKTGCRRNCVCPASKRWKPPIGFCASATSPSSIGYSPSRHARKEPYFASVRARIWMRCSRFRRRER
jgi:transposase